MFERIEGIPPLRDAIIVLTAFAAEANKCTPELQAVMAKTIKIAATSSMVFIGEDTQTKGSDNA